MGVDSSPVGNADSIVGGIIPHVFTGSAADSVIAILMLVVAVLGFAVWLLAKRLDEKDRILTDTVEKSNSELKNLAEKYMESMDSYHQQQVDQARIINESLTGTRILLTELKGLMTIISIRGDSK